MILRGRSRFSTRGIHSLGDKSEGVYLHKTVLIYNLAQRDRRLGDLADQRIAAYERLGDLCDGNTPEYHMELALSLIDAERIDEAIAELETAHRLDPAIPEGSVPAPASRSSSATTSATS